jgi:hypothetical protein
LRPFAITWSAAIQQHHRVEATDLRLFEAVGKRIGLLYRDAEML